MLLHHEATTLQTISVGFDRLTGRIVKELFPLYSPPALYHYVKTFDGLSGIISGRNIWIKHAGDFAVEHGQELTFADELIPAVADEIARERGGSIARLMAQFIQTFPDHKISTNSDFDVYLACFCREAERPILWQRFAGNGSGYCLGLRVLANEHFSIPNAEPTRFRVEYDPVAARSTLSTGFIQVAKYYRRVSGRVHLSPAGERELIRQGLSQLYSIAAFVSVQHKAEKYSDELEDRIFVFPREGHALEALTDPRQLVLPLREPGKALAIESLYVGQHAQVGVDQVQAFLRAQGYGADNGEPMPQVLLSRVKLGSGPC